VEAIRELHASILQVSGGRSGENTARLLGACGRAFQTFGGEQFYATDMEKAAALFHGIISGHAFVDGNKRTATITVVLFLAARNVIGVPSPLQVRLLGELAVETAASSLPVDDVIEWFHRILDP